MNKRRAIFLSLLLLVPSVAFAGVFWHDADKEIVTVGGPTQYSAAKGWIRLTPQEAVPLVESDGDGHLVRTDFPMRYIKSVAGKPAEKTAEEKATADAAVADAADTAQKTSRLAEFIAARAQLESLNAAKAEMNGVKILTRIDARITTAEARRDAAFAALMDLP